MIDMRNFDAATRVLVGSAWVKLSGDRRIDTAKWHGGGTTPVLIADTPDGLTIIPFGSICAVIVDSVADYVSPWAGIDTSPVTFERATVSRPDGLARGPVAHPANTPAR